ncbi:MAG: cob(I)yrinic acid a,c-diamide adenosyltransferase [Candidatus Thioglobus sp.]|jgi:cob(I)alamin adenosyltransferase|nr:cob(I)yrinic acid a,c-diamide adenosyltransferase [Candidatus Thioglobus sp.]
MDNSYKKRMQRKKEYIDSRIDAANIDKGIIVLLTGNGKGKSSSAMGMICRSLAYDMKVGVVRFLKGEQASGEDIFLKNQKGISIFLMKAGFTWDTQNKQLDMEKALEAWVEAKNFLNDPEIGLVVLDEITYMVSYNYIDEKSIIKALSGRPKNQHVVITGRAASKNLIEIADTVSEVNNIKHAFSENIRAQQGIDL